MTYEHKAILKKSEFLIKKKNQCLILNKIVITISLVKLSTRADHRLNEHLVCLSLLKDKVHTDRFNFFVYFFFFKLSTERKQSVV